LKKIEKKERGGGGEGKRKGGHIFGPKKQGGLRKKIFVY